MLVSADDLVPIALEETERDRLYHCVREWVTIDVAGTICAVGFDNAEHAERFGRRYAALRVTGRPVLAAFALTDAAGPVFGTFGAREQPAYRWPGAPPDAERFVFFADAVALTLFFRAIPGVLAIHAGAVGDGNGVAALIGESNAGKTTTTLACARLGMSLYSDERCVFTPAGVVPFPRAVNVRAGGRTYLAADGIDDAFADMLAANGEDAWHDRSFADLFGSWTPPKAAPLRSAFLIEGSGPKPSLEPVRRTEALRSALRWAACPESGLDRFTRVLASFGGAACYRLTLGSPAATAQLIAATLARDVRAAAKSA